MVLQICSLLFNIFIVNICMVWNDVRNGKSEYFCGLNFNLSFHTTSFLLQYSVQVIKTQKFLYDFQAKSEKFLLKWFTRKLWNVYVCWERLTYFYLWVMRKKVFSYNHVFTAGSGRCLVAHLEKHVLTCHSLFVYNLIPKCSEIIFKLAHSNQHRQRIKSIN